MPNPLYPRLKERAAENRRSLNSEILVALEQGVAATPPDPKALLARVDALRGKLHVAPLTDGRLRAKLVTSDRPLLASFPDDAVALTVFGAA